jgi:hypothetical protein
MRFAHFRNRLDRIRILRNFIYSLNGRGTRKVKKWPSLKQLTAKPASDRLAAVEAGLSWLKQSQDACKNNGSSAFFSIGNRAWAPAYPETTGYIIVTLYEALDTLNLPVKFAEDLRERALKMAGWLLAVQLPDGGFPGCFAEEYAPNIFNTGQILSGLLTAGLKEGNQIFLKAAERAADWMLKAQEPDGGWQKYIYDRDCRGYYSRAAWPLALASGEKCFPRHADYERAARKFADFVVARQRENGWIAGCSFFTNAMKEEYPVLHTIAYTIEGLLEIGSVFNENKYIEAAMRAAEKLMRRFEIDGALYGEYDERWHPIADYKCVTGCAQMGRIWGRCYEISGDLRYLNAMLKMNSALRFIQPVGSVSQEIRGGFPGSIPIHEKYQPNRWPNWAVKFALDSFLIELRLLQRLDGVETRSNSNETRVDVRATEV